MGVFRQHEGRISTIELKKGLTSDPVLAVLAADLKKLGFDVEVGKDTGCKIERPVFFGENGEPSLRYQVDAYHPEWRTGLEVEEGRAILGNAIFRDSFQAMVMTDVDHSVLAVPNTYNADQARSARSIHGQAQTLMMVRASSMSQARSVSLGNSS